jgi:DNA polymerase III epsilon subunit-like protein
MLKEHIVIFVNEFKKIPNDLKINYIYEENYNIKKELRLESREENHFRIRHNLPRPKITTNKYFIFDTETTGLPLKNNYRCCSYEDIHGWVYCRMISIGWLIVDSEFKILKSFSTLIKDNSFENTISAQCINHISNEDREQHGIHFSEMMSYLNQDISDCDYIVSHGTDFDFNLLISECIKREISTDSLKNKIVLNTKQNLWKENYKQNLADIVSLDLTQNEEIQNLKPHDALYDSYLCLELLKIRLK